MVQLFQAPKTLAPGFSQSCSTQTKRCDRLEQAWAVLQLTEQGPSPSPSSTLQCLSWQVTSMLTSCCTFSGISTSQPAFGSLQGTRPGRGA